ncbi:hypothetical protein OAG24_00570 [bacterium]|nr:hypothetical protein [bacterium]
MEKVMLDVLILDIKDRIEIGGVDFFELQSEFLNLFINLKIISKKESIELLRKFDLESINSKRGIELAEKINDHFNVTSVEEWKNIDDDDMNNFIKNVTLYTDGYDPFHIFFLKIVQFIKGAVWKEKCRQFCLEYMPEYNL